MRMWYRFWQRASQVVFSAFFNIRVLGREHISATGPVLLLSNHQSYLDPVLCGLGLSRELDYVARDSLFRNRFFGRYIRSLNAFPIQRGQADIAAIKTVLKRLKQGRAIVLFPEATRTRDGRIRPIKSGFELIARRGKAPVIPVVVDGAFEAWPRQRVWPCPARIYVMFGQPITPDEMRQMGRAELVETLNSRLRMMQHRLRERYRRRCYVYPDDQQASSTKE